MDICSPAPEIARSASLGVNPTSGGTATSWPWMAKRIAVSPETMATTISTSASIANRNAAFIPDQKYSQRIIGEIYSPRGCPTLVAAFRDRVGILTSGFLDVEVLNVGVSPRAPKIQPGSEFRIHPPVVPCNLIQQQR